MERTIQRVQPVRKAVRKQLYTAAYVRVSCEKDAMRKSLYAQTDYYQKYIRQHEDWIFAGIYADEFYSGTKDDRPRFQQMLKDCMNGKINRIITKSISRFARNTVTLLTVVRTLRDKGIGVYFEKQNIDTLSGSGELLLTLLASQAQEESRMASENCKWRIRRMFEQGYTTHFNMNGYRSVHGLVQPVPEEAETVQRIFRLYLEGNGIQGIANRLQKENVPTRLGGEWTATTISSILRNEKYAGDLLLQKSFVTDHLSKIQKKNEGERPKYFVENDHEAIIGRSDFEAAQTERKRRAALHAYGRGELSELSSKIRCGICGKHYRRKMARSRAIWVCSTYNTRCKRYCPSNSVPETVIREGCTQVLEMDEYDDALVDEKIREITAMPDHLLIFRLADGKQQEIRWKFPTRSESWTEERRRAAAEKVRKYHAEHQ